MSTNKATFGLSENVAGCLSYALQPITGIVFLVCERENRFVRFHALQSIVTFIALYIINWLFNLLLGWVPIIGGLGSWLCGVITFALWIYLMYTTYNGGTFKVPIIGDVVWANVNK
jgi:uncharacterized membrane protein